MADLFDIYDEISEAVAGELQLALTPDATRKSDPTDNIQAYDYFLQARAMLQAGRQDYEAYLKTRGLKRDDVLADDLLAQGENLLQTEVGYQSAENAQHFFARAVESDSGFARAWAGLCQALLDGYYYQPEAEKLEQAKFSCRTAVELEPTLVEGHIALGDLYRKIGWLDDALEEYRLAMASNETPAGAWLGMAEALAVQGQDEEAENAYHQAIDLDPDDLRSYYALGYFLFTRGRYEDAASVYGHLAGHPKADASAFMGQGVAYFMLGDFKNSAQAYRQVIAFRPTAAAYSNVGTQYFYDGRFEDAATMYRQAATLGPTNPVWWGNLGDALQQTDGGRAAAAESYREAAALAGEMLQANPDDAEVLTNLGYYQSRLGEDQLAMSYLARAEMAAPHDIYVYYYAALAHLEAGRYQDALTAVGRSLERGYPAVLLGRDPQFAALEGDETFLGLIRE
jgi:tetratricopeptide (TPR) repeat protein